MKIGILTLPLHTNYGGILQAYALQTVLERMGHEVVVFNTPLEEKPLYKRNKVFQYTKRFIKRFILRNKSIHVFQERFDFRNEFVERKYTQQFIEHYIHQYPIWYLNQIKKSEFDAIVVGSDQIWRMRYFRFFWSTKGESDAFLYFTKDWNIKRIAYAASFGIDKPDIAYNYLCGIKEVLSLFNGVSVREKPAVESCKKLFNVDAKWVLDPTMLLEVSDYLDLVKREEAKKEPMLMSYILDETSEISELRDRIAKEKGLKVKLSNLPDSGTNERGTKAQPPVEEWLRAFMNAEYVINDSFHACVFSILFHKQFTVIGNKKRGLSRFQSLLEMFGLESRLITDPLEYKPLPAIDYDEVDKILRIRREESISFISESLY